MNILDLTKNSNEQFALGYGVKKSEMNAKTLGISLTAIANLLELINQDINPGHDYEIFVNETADGSFWVSLKNQYIARNNMLSALGTNVVLPILLMIFYDNFISNDDVIIINNTESYIIHHGKERIILPKSTKQISDRVIDKLPAKKTFTKHSTLLIKIMRLKTLVFITICVNDMHIFLYLGKRFETFQTKLYLMKKRKEFELNTLLCTSTKQFYINRKTNGHLFGMDVEFPLQ